MNLLLYTTHIRQMENDLRDCFNSHDIDIQIHSKIQSSHYLLMVMDAHTPIDFNQCRLEHPKALMIFIGNEQEVFDLLPYSLFYYIRENHFESDWQKCLASLNKYLDENFRVLDIKAGRSRIRLRIQSILYIESFRHYLTIHSTVGTYILRQNITQLSEQLKTDGFIRCHKSYLVNKHYIQDRTLDELILQDQSRLPIGRAFQQALDIIDK